MGGSRRDPRRIVETPEAPAAVGPYSQAVEVNGFLFCSGQIPLDPETGQLVAEPIEAATERCLLNLGAILRAAGAGMSDVVQVTVCMTDLGRFAEMNEVYARFFPKDPPARVTVGVAALPKDAPVEIAATALAPSAVGA